VVEERITETRTPDGDTHTTHTEIIREEPRRSGGAGWGIVIVLVLAVVIGAFFLMQGNSAEVAKDNAIADAATNIGSAAQSVGNAADKAADSIAN